MAIDVSTRAPRRAEQPDRTHAAAAPRLDIQGLRAVAVLGVLVFHFWPARLTGGYVGVDVFFVISGFLITSHLLRTPCVDRQTLLQFWGRRVRRLLPAASVVLLVTLVASVFLLPQPSLGPTATEALAATFYVENWALAATSIDYLAADNAPSPIQHYWSLSVEEQFYLIWPVLIGALFLFAAARRLPLSRTLWLGLAGVGVASLGASVWLTINDPGLAYFATHARIWELVIGALVALAVFSGRRIPGRVLPTVLAWGGLAAVAITMIWFDESTPFPGYTALLPTLGTAAVIMANAERGPWSPTGVFAWRPIQYVGDISYSVYLWHWPAIILIPYVLDRPPNWGDKLVLIVVTIVLAGLTKRFVEDPLRAQRGWLKPLWRTFAMGATCMAVVATTALVVNSQVEGGVQRDTEVVAQAELDPDRCFAGGAIRNEESCKPVEGDTLITSPSYARRDVPRVYRDDCVTPRPYLERPNCIYAERGSDTRVALLGNSVAAQWFPAAEGMAKRNKWELQTYLAATCYPVLTERVDFKEPGVADSCRDFQRWAIDEIIRTKTDLVVVSSRTNAELKDVPPSEKLETATRSYLAMLNLLTDKGIRVLVIGNNPDPGLNIPDCVADNLSNPRKCDVKRDKSVKPDALMLAAAESKSDLISQFDASDLVCLTDRCPAVLGGVIAYRDFTHLSATMTRSLRPELERAAERTLALR